MASTLALDEILGRLSRDELPWEKAWRAEYQAFADCFTLHDSAWVGVFLHVREADEAVFVFEWDAHWLPEPLRGICNASPPGTNGTVDPWLFIRLSTLSNMRLTGYEQDCSGRAVGDAICRVNGGVNVLEVRDFVGGTIEATFKGPAEFLALLRDGNVINLRGVTPRESPPPALRPWWRFW